MRSFVLGAREGVPSRGGGYTRGQRAQYPSFFDMVTTHVFIFLSPRSHGLRCWHRAYIYLPSAYAHISSNMTLLYPLSPPPLRTMRSEHPRISPWSARPGSGCGNISSSEGYGTDEAPPSSLRSDVLPFTPISYDRVQCRCRNRLADDDDGDNLDREGWGSYTLADTYV